MIPFKGQRVQRHVTLDRTTIDIIQKTAANLDLNFSRTIEALALLGLQDTKTHTAFELHRTAADQGVTRSLHRFFKLLSQTVIAANEAKHMAQQVFLLQLVALSAELHDPEDVLPSVSIDPSDAVGEALIQLYAQRQQRARNRAVRDIKRNLREWDDLWTEIMDLATDEMEGDDDTAIDAPIR